MKIIDQHIKDLLSTHDCVIIPGFGAFIADYKPAVIKPEKSSLPSKYILFNSKLSRNDGLLINAIVESENISYPEAKKAIARYVIELNTEIEEGHKHILQGIGTLQLDEAGFIQFTEQEDNTCLLDTYGLPPIILKKIEKKENNKNTTTKPNHYLHNTLKIAAAAAVIITVILISRPSAPLINTDYASLSFENDSQSITTEDKHAKEDEPATHLEETIESALPQEQDSTKTNTLSNNNPPNIYHEYYHVIIASLASQQKAKEYIVRFKNKYQFEDLSILEGDARYRVSVARFYQSKEAVAFVNSLRLLNPTFKDVWVLPYKQLEVITPE